MLQRRVFFYKYYQQHQTSATRHIATGMSRWKLYVYLAFVIIHVLYKFITILTWCHSPPKKINIEPKTKFWKGNNSSSKVAAGSMFLFVFVFFFSPPIWVSRGRSHGSSNGQVPWSWSMRLNPSSTRWGGSHGTKVFFLPTSLPIKKTDLHWIFCFWWFLLLDSLVEFEWKRWIFGDSKF